MKKKIVLMLLLILFPSRALAQNYINYECPQEIDSEEVECTVTGYSDEEISAVDIKIKNTNITEFTIDESWQGSYENNELLIYTDNNKTGLFNIGKIKINVENSGVINIENEYSSFFNDNFEEIVIEGTKNVNIEETEDKSKNNYTKYVIIILIIVVCMLLIIGLILRRKKDKGVK